MYLNNNNDDDDDEMALQQNWVFSPDQVRAIAAEHEYPEISHNTTSRVISFRHDTTRINVYYTTGTVGTCLNHPTKGKTQLFRRNIVTLEQLEAIFRNPRKHTGQGYYTRNNASQEWKLTVSKNRNNSNNNNRNNNKMKTITDMARRWEYVATAADLTDGDDSALHVLVDAMNRISHLLWDRNTIPTFVAADGLKYACGSLSGVAGMVQQVAQGYGAAGMCRLRDVQHYQQRGGRRPELHPVECHDECDNVEPFLDVHQRDLHAIEKLLNALPIRLRKDVCNWLIGLKRCGAVFVDPDYRYHWDEQVAQLHEEYSELFYVRTHLAQVCTFHGVVRGVEDGIDDNSN